MLDRRWRSGEGQIFLLWGRRRVGKTELLLEFGRGKKTLFFEATSGTRADHLADFSERLAEASGRGAGLVAPNWRAALDAVADWVEAEGPALLVLDEFQHIARASPEIGTEINVWWRERGASLPLLLVLSGSEVGFFEREVVSYSASTYGRRAGQLRLEPFRPRDVGLFLPGWSAEDRVRAYGVFGNMPYYLAHVREDAGLAENILDLILMRDGLLHEEARLLLDVELPDAASYFSVLRAIAAGQTRVSQIDSRTGIGDTSRVSQMLDQLQRLWLVRKELPVTVRNPERSRQSFYRITDPYLRFWFRFVLPAQGRLADADGARRHLERPRAAAARRVRRFARVRGGVPGVAARRARRRRGRLVVGQGPRAAGRRPARHRSRARRRRGRRGGCSDRRRFLQVDRRRDAGGGAEEGRGPGGAPTPRRSPAGLPLLTFRVRALAARRGGSRPEAQPGRGRGRSRLISRYVMTVLVHS